MQPEDFRPDDLFGQIQSLVDRLDVERGRREAAEAANSAKSELLAMVGHELRTPMETVVAMAELLLTSPLDPTQRRSTETLAQSARSLLSVLNDVMDLSKLETGRLDLASDSFDLYALVQSVASELQARANEKGLTSGVDIGANCPQFIVGDETRVRKVLTSLINAALKGTSEGSVRLYVSARDDAGSTIRFDVTETGAGFSEAELEQLFRPSVGAVEGVGSGLGLPMAQRLAEAMGGEVGCDSKLGQGSLYWFYWPTRQADCTPGEEVTSDAAAPALAQDALVGHVLVVEDNMVNRMLIRAYLEEFGLTYEMVDTGAAALMFLAAKSYDVVLLDTAMPAVDSVEIVDCIRRLNGPAAEVPIIALTAHAKKADAGSYLSSGMNAQVSKPIRGRELLAALAPFLAARKDGESKAAS